MEFVSLFKGIGIRRIGTQSIYWLSFSVFLATILYFFAGVSSAVKITLVIVLPVIPAVYLNIYFYDRYFQKGEYIKYLTWAIISIGLCSLLAQWVANSFYNTEEENLGAFLDPLLFVLISMGLRAFRDSLRNKYIIQEARAKQAEAELKIKDFESRQVRVELDLLKAQVNPHFLFNTLNSIYSLALDNSNKTAAAVMLLSKIMRYQLEYSQKPMVALENEYQFIANYIELEQFRLNNKCKINFTAEGIHQNHVIPPMLLIPLVENCFKHGIGIEKDKNKIQISMFVDNNNLAFNSFNFIPKKKSSYIGDSMEKTGLINIRKRLELAYPGKHKLTIEKSDTTFKVALMIEL